jgi:hypothetical protein
MKIMLKINFFILFRVLVTSANIFICSVIASYVEVSLQKIVIFVRFLW